MLYHDARIFSKRFKLFFFFVFCFSLDFIMQGCSEKDFITLKDKLSIADIVAYIEVLEVDNIIKETDKNIIDNNIYNKQRVTSRVLKILKGNKKLENETIIIKKPESFFYFNLSDRQVVSIISSFGSYKIIGHYRGEYRLASVLAELNKLKKNSSGIVIGLSNHNSQKNGIIYYVLKNRQKYPLHIDSKDFEVSLLTKVETDIFGVSQIELPEGSYTILKQNYDGELFSFNRLVENFYPYVKIKKNEWKAIYF